MLCRISSLFIAVLLVCLIGGSSTSLLDTAAAVVSSPSQVSRASSPSDSLGALRVKRGLLTEDAERLLRQASQVDVNNVGQLADLVERNNAVGCLARVICELTNNPRLHGEPGTKFAQSLLKFRQSKHPKVKQYVDAMAYGAKSQNSDQCKAHYPRCDHSTTEVVSVGNKLLHRA